MEGQIRIGSWNLCNFSKKRKLEDIAEIAQSFDLLAIQEVRDEDCVINLCKMINYNYRISAAECSTETSAHQSGKRKERYAFIWNYRVELIDEPELVCAGKYFVRSPFTGYFRGDKLDFILSTIHVVWGKASDRQLEISHIQELLDQIVVAAGGERDILLCGDFNTPPEKFHLSKNWCPLIKMPTTAARKVGGKGSRYDNIWLTSNTNVIDEGVIMNALKLSDHYPIFVVLKSDEDLDDQDHVNLSIKL